MTEQDPTTPQEPPQASSPPPSGSPSADTGLDPQVGGLLAYLLFGWIGGLIMLLTQKHPEVRFHGLQSILYSAALLAVFVGLGIVGGIVGLVPGLGFVGGLLSLVLYPLVWLASVALWIFLCVKGYQLAHVKLPMLGDLAEQWTGYHRGG